MFGYTPIPVFTHNGDDTLPSALHDITLIKMRYARLMSTKGLLITYSNGHAQ